MSAGLLRRRDRPLLLDLRPRLRRLRRPRSEACLAARPSLVRGSRGVLHRGKLPRGPAPAVQPVLVRPGPQRLCLPVCMRRCAAANLRLRSLQCRRLSSRSSTSPAVVFLVAGEASGDVIGGRLMRALRNEYGGAIHFEGVGGDSMRAEGLASSLFPMSELSVAGFAEVLPSLPRIAARLVQTQRAVRRAQPHVVVGIDSKGFNLRLLRSLAHRRAAAGRNGIPAAPVLVQYVGPSAWAFGDADARAARLRGGVDELLVLLPFEEAAAAASPALPRSPGPPPRPRAPASTGALAAHGPAPCPTPRRSFGAPECPPPLSDTRRSTTWRSEASRRARRRSGRPRRRPSGAKSASRRARKSSACCLVAVRKRRATAVGEASACLSATPRVAGSPGEGDAAAAAAWRGEARRAAAARRGAL